ncbi:MAG: dihydroorotase [Deltaproteobacteria bacterium]|nr:dihydroorotase [Deltaproteobacteria bacterium]
MTHPTVPSPSGPSPNTVKITIARPDDMHVHLRDGDALLAVAPHTARQFARAIVMPNLKPPITTTEQALAYRARILSALNTDTLSADAPNTYTPPPRSFEPLMTLYLTDSTAPAEIRRAKASGHIYACKLYPAGATTHSDAGVTSIVKIRGVLEAMAEEELPLLIHGEVTDTDIDIFDREAVFIERTLAPLVQSLPTLKIVLEHITTTEAVDFVLAAPPNVAATITAHHLLYDRNALFVGGLRPHYYCLPVLKRHQHRQALLRAIASGNPKFFLGTDSAPHAQSQKEAACGCAGCYTAHAAIELYAEAFESVAALDKLDAFASAHGAQFYGLSRNQGTLVLERERTSVPDAIPYGPGGESSVVPLRAGGSLTWRVTPR